MCVHAYLIIAGKYMLKKDTAVQWYKGTGIRGGSYRTNGNGRKFYLSEILNDVMNEHPQNSWNKLQDQKGVYLNNSKKIPQNLN